MATSPLPSRGPKRERKCYVTPAFSGVSNAKRREKAERAHRWAHRLQACIFSRIGNCFFAVRSCNFFIFAVSACRKKSSHRVIFFVAVSRVIIFCGKQVYKKVVKMCNFFAAMRVTGLHEFPQKKLHDWTIFFVTRIYRKKKFYCLPQCTSKRG